MDFKAVYDAVLGASNGNRGTITDVADRFGGQAVDIVVGFSGVEVLGQRQVEPA